MFFLFVVVRRRLHPERQSDPEAEEATHQNIEEVADNKNSLSRAARFARAQPFAILLATFFFLILKIPQFASLFWFTQNQGQVLLAFFSFGYLIASQNLSFITLALFHHYRRIQIALLVSYVIFVSALDITANKGSVFLLAAFLAVLGVVLALLTVLELHVLDKEMDQGTVPLSLTIFGVYGAGLCALGDFTHYMNRDSPTWSYITVGLSGVLVAMACLFSADCCGRK